MKTINADLLAILKEYVDADFEMNGNTTKAIAHNDRLQRAKDLIATIEGVTE